MIPPTAKWRADEGSSARPPCRSLFCPRPGGRARTCRGRSGREPSFVAGVLIDVDPPRPAVLEDAHLPRDRGTGPRIRPPRRLDSRSRRLPLCPPLYSVEESVHGIVGTVRAHPSSRGSRRADPRRRHPTSATGKRWRSTSSADVDSATRFARTPGSGSPLREAETGCRVDFAEPVIQFLTDATSTAGSLRGLLRRVREGAPLAGPLTDIVTR